MLEWTDLRYFLAVWRTGTLSGAARRLKVNQTTVGRRLAVLEEALNARLFDRTVDGHVLTASGERVLSLAQSMEDAVAQMERQVLGEDVRLEGTVRLSTNQTLAEYYLLKHHEAFRARYPGIRLELVIGTPSLNLLKREADLGLRAGTQRPPAQQNVIARRLPDLGWALYASAAYLRRCRAPLRSLAGHRVVAFEGELAELAAQKWLEQHAAAVSGAEVVLRTNSIHTAGDAVQAGLGVGALPCVLGAGLPGVRRLSRELVTVAGLWLVVHPDLLRTARVRAVMDHLVERLSASPGDLLEGKPPSRAGRRGVAARVRPTS